MISKTLSIRNNFYPSRAFSSVSYSKFEIPPYIKNPNTHFISKNPQRIGIIGSGIAGLIAAKTLKQQGYQIEVLEENSGLGGTWFEGYENVGLEGPFFSYQIPDWEFPPGTEFFPKLPAIQNHLQGYSDHFGVSESIRFNQHVNEIKQEADQSWTCKMKDGSSRNYDFLVLSTGMFHQKNIPNFKGEEFFKGKIIHTTEMKDAKIFAEGKKVVVLGCMKSAWDILRISYPHAENLTLVTNENQLGVPGTAKMFRMPIIEVLISRFSTLFLPKLDGTPEYFTKYCRPLVELFYREILKTENDLPDELKLSGDIEEIYPIKIYLRDQEMVDLIKQKKIEYIQGDIDEIESDSLVIGGEKVPCDLLVCATGYKPAHFGLEDPDGNVFLYRYILKPGLKNLAAIGWLETFFNPLCYNMQAVWLTEVLRGKVKLPSIEEMEIDVEKRKKYLLESFKEIHQKGSTIMQPVRIIDQLLEDMEISTRRKSSTYEHWISILNSKDYLDVVTKRV